MKTVAPHFAGVYPLKLRYPGRPDFDAEREIVSHALLQKHGEGKEAEVLQYVYNVGSGKAIQAEPYAGVIRRLDAPGVTMTDSITRLNEDDGTSIRSGYLWVEDDERGNHATQLREHYKKWQDTLGQALRGYYAKGLLERLKHRWHTKTIFEDIPKNRMSFFNVDTAPRDALKATLMAFFNDLAPKAPAMELRREDRVHWTKGGKPVNTTLMQK